MNIKVRYEKELVLNLDHLDEEFKNSNQENKKEIEFRIYGDWYVSFFDEEGEFIVGFFDDEETAWLAATYSAKYLNNKYPNVIVDTKSLGDMGIKEIKADYEHVI